MYHVFSKAAVIVGASRQSTVHRSETDGETKLQNTGQLTTYLSDDDDDDDDDGTTCTQL